MEITEEDHHQKPHIAILPAPGMGHVIPHLEFAKRLVSLHGFRVTFLVLTTHSSAAQSHFLLRHSTISSLRIIFLPTRPISHLITPQTQIQTRISIIIRESLSDIQSILAGAATLGRPTALVVDFFATDAFSVADNLRIPKYIFFTSPATEVAFMMYLPTFDREISGEFVHLSDPLCVPGCNPTRIQDLVDPVRNRKADGYKWFLHHASRFPIADGIIINTCEDLERIAITALRENEILRRIPTPRVYPVGPLINTDAGGPVIENQWWRTWFDQQPPESVIYVSFGSGGTMGGEQIIELAYGLELSRQRFIWVVRRPFEADASGTYFDVGGEENVPGDYLPEGFLQRVEGVGIVIPSWAPQIEILRHRSTGGFLSHCGWNSTLESVVHGVPMIAWPLYAEQKLNATLLVEEVGVAVRVGGEREEGEVGVVGREEIERAVRLVMEGEEGKVIRGKVKEVKERVLRARDEGGGSSFSSLCEVANEWKAYTATAAAAAANN